MTNFKLPTELIFITHCQPILSFCNLGHILEHNAGNQKRKMRICSLLFIYAKDSVLYPSETFQNRYKTLHMVVGLLPINHHMTCLPIQQMFLCELHQLGYPAETSNPVSTACNTEYKCDMNLYSLHCKSSTWGLCWFT